MGPGSALPDHQHMLNEQTYVIKEHLVCNEGECKAGEFVWRPAGSRHSSWSPNGGTIVGVNAQTCDHKNNYFYLLRSDIQIPNRTRPRANA